MSGSQGGAALPLPPIQLANRVGVLIGEDGAYDAYLEVGAQLRSFVDHVLPEGWTWDGKRVVDFGAGSGRVLRHFLPEASSAHFEGHDIDATAIEWLNANMNPPFTGFVNGAEPPLACEDHSVDVVYAFSVFSHLTDSWAAWLLEIHRVLVPGGWLIASYLGGGLSQAIAGEPWDPDRVGMNVLKAHQGWDDGGPSVFLSSWWIREHWGRAFEIEVLHDVATEGNQNVVVARPREGVFTEEQLLRPADDPREIAALRHNLVQVQREAAASAALAQELILAANHGQGEQSFGRVLDAKVQAVRRTLHHDPRLEGLRALRRRVKRSAG